MDRAALWTDAEYSAKGDGMMLFPGYNPYGPHSKPARPTDPGDVPLPRLKAALRANAMCLSTNGKYAYTMRLGKLLEAEWNGQDYGTWFEIAGDDFPAGSVRM